MLGIQIRGIRHLYKLACGASEALRIFNVNGPSQVRECLIFPTKNENNVVIIDKELHCSRNDSERLKTHFIGIIKDENKEYFNNIVATYSPQIFTLSNLNPIQGGFSSGYRFGNLTVAITSKTFDDEYNIFCKTNQKVLSNVFGKYIDANSPFSKFLYILCNGNANFVGWACKMIVRHGISISAIKHFMEFDNDYKQLVKNLTKGNIIALNNSSEIAKAITEIFHLRAQAVAKQVINWFNPQQKKLLREKLNDDEVIHILNNFDRLSLVKKSNFIRKSSTLDNADEIIRMMSYLCTNTHFVWNKDAFLDFLKNVNDLNYEIVHQKDNFIVLKVNDYETVKRLGKSTNWCITKNLQYWENYMGRKNNHVEVKDNAIHIPDSDCEHVTYSTYSKRFNDFIENIQEKSCSAMQFMAFDFNEKEDSLYSIVGFTVSPMNGGVTHAHDFVNNSMMPCSGGVGVGVEAPHALHRRRIPQTITLWNIEIDNEESKNQTDSIISTFLNKHNINVSDLCNYRYPRCEWNKESVVKVLKYFCHPDDIITLFEDDTKLIIRSYTDNVVVLMTNPLEYFNNQSSYVDDSKYVKKGCVIHFDFSKKANDTNKILIWQIFENSNDKVETSSHAFNETGLCVTIPFMTITDMFDYYGLPFDTIKRPDTIEYRIMEYSKKYEYDKIFNLLTSIGKENIKPLQSSKTTRNIIRMCSEMIERHNFDYWKKFCNLDINILNFIGKETALSIITNIFQSVLHTVTLSDFVRKNNCYTVCSDFDAFILFSKKNKKDWDKYANDENISFQKKANKANTYICMHNIAAYTMILESLITKLLNDGWDSIYDTIIPNFITRIYDYGCINIEQNYKTLHEVFNHLIKNNLNKWVNVNYNNINVIFKLLTISNCSTIALTKLSSILKSDLKPRNISKLITDLDRYCNNEYSNKTYYKVLNMICKTAVETHALSEATVEQIMAVRVNNR